MGASLRIRGASTRGDIRLSPGNPKAACPDSLNFSRGSAEEREVLVFLFLVALVAVASLFKLTFHPTTLNKTVFMIAAGLFSISLAAFLNRYGLRGEFPPGLVAQSRESVGMSLRETATLYLRPKAF